MSSENTNIDENEIKSQQPQPTMIIHESQGSSKLLMIGLIVCLLILILILYLGFTASKQPLGSILGILSILFLIIFAFNYKYLLNLLIFQFLYLVYARK